MNLTRLKPKVTFSRSLLGVLVSSSIASAPAMAQLEEIIVTANKRAESANDIGMSISALSGDKLQDQQLVSLEEITSAVPGLVFATSQQNTPILTMRGVGFNDSSLGVYPAVSLYVDEVPLPFPAMASHSAYDLERVEVLKGPQGVLFGQNSTGGAINFIAAKPTQDLAFGGNAGYGRFNRFETNGFVSGPLSDKLGARLSFQNVQADEWQKSQTRPGDENGKEDYTAGRLLLNFQPTDTSEINVNLNAWRDKSDPQAFQFVAATPKLFNQAPSKAAEVFAVPLTDKDPQAADWSEAFEPKGDKEFYQASIRGDFDLNESNTLTTILAYSDFEQDQVHDGDGGAHTAADFEHNKGEIDSTFAEIRLAHDAGEGIRAVVGANYEDSSTFEDQLLRYVNNTTHRASALFINGSGSTMDQDIESYAFFGNIDYDMTEVLTLKVGARYTDTQIDAESCGYAPPNLPGVPDPFGNGSNVADLFNILGARSTRFVDPVGEGDCYTLDAAAGAGGTLTPEAGIPGIPFTDTLAEDNFSWRAGLDYRVNEDVLLYGNISQGYKVGSYPSLAGATWNELQPVTQESVLAYEVGFKASLLDNRMQWNGAIFYNDYEDKQVRGKFEDPIFGPLDRLVNIPESTILGVETDIVAQLTDNLTLTAAVTYLDSEVEDYPAEIAFDAYGNQRDLSGNDLPYTPALTYSLDLDYRMPLDNGGVLFMGGNLVGQTDADAVFDGDDLDLTDAPLRDVGGGVLITGVEAGFHKSITEHYFVVEEYYTLGARMGYESADGRWRVMLWGKNITDEYYWNGVIASSENGARIAGKPRTYGLTVGYTY